MWQGLKVSLLAGRVLPSFALTGKPFPALGEEMFQLARLSKQCLCSPPDGSSKKTKQLLYLLWCIRRGKGNFAKETKHYALKFSLSHPNTPKYVFWKGKANNYRCISLTTSHVSLVVHCYDLFHFLRLIYDRVSGLIFLHTDNMIPHVSLYSIFFGTTKPVVCLSRSFFHRVSSFPPPLVALFRMAWGRQSPPFDSYSVWYLWLIL